MDTTTTMMGSIVFTIRKASARYNMDKLRACLEDPVSYPPAETTKLFSRLINAIRKAYLFHNRTLTSLEQRHMRNAFRVADQLERAIAGNRLYIVTSN